METHTSVPSVPRHVPVLLHESVTSLAIAPTDTIVDGTFGGGGHSKAIAALVPQGTLICVDLDEAAEARFGEQFADVKNVSFVHANFKDAAVILAEAKITAVDKVLLDLGTSVFQLLSDTRGFSFNSDVPLAMTFSSHGSHTGFNAHDIVNSWQESSIADIIYAYGEEVKSRRIARAIVEARAITPIMTSLQLATIIATAMPRNSRIHPATKTFQALRIAVNDELGTLTHAMNAWWDVLNTGGRISIITFHSLEDRIVKQWMRDHPNSRVITKKPLSPSKEELSSNPRSRSAKLRTIEKI
jgi:16S rRNA (cytosine1402-N4)-methyltransferase